MPTRTPARPSTRPGDPSRGRASGLIAAAGLFAVAELGLAVTIGGFFAFGRAEALIFLAFRPWLLLLLACALARRDWRMRAAGYALALSFAALGETLFLHILGSADRLWNDALAGLLAGGLLALLLDLLVQLGRRAGGRLGPVVGFAAGAALLLIPGGLFLYDRILLEPAPAPAEDRPELMLMTALPIIWGESGAFDPTSSPAESYHALRREFRVRPLDNLSRETLTGRLLLLAETRALAPEELVALYRLADVMLVTPVRDGMNLIAKEYVASRIDDSGVLILSEFAGAAQELRRALLVNPHDVDGIVSTLDRALELSPEDTRRRMRWLRSTVRRHDVYAWADSFFEALRD